MAWEETLQTIAFAMARFSAFAAHALIFGTAPILLLVLRPSLEPLGEESWGPGRRRLAGRLEGLIQAALVAAAVATAVVLVLQAALTSGLFGGDMTMSTFESVFDTPFAQWHLFRYPLLLALAVLLVGKVRTHSLAGTGDARKSPSVIWWTAWGGLGTALLATTSFSGHAAVATPRFFAYVNDVVHLAAGATWFTGIILLAIALPDAWRGKLPAERLELLAPVVVRFSRVAFVAIMIVAVTGTISSLLHVESVGDIVGSPYGRVLGLKILVFVAILALGASNHFVLRARMMTALRESKPTGAQRLFRRTIAAELAVALIVFGLTGVLVGQARTKKLDAAPVISTSVVRPGSL